MAKKGNNSGAEKESDAVKQGQQIVIMIKVLMKWQKWQMVFAKRQWSLKVMW